MAGRPTKRTPETAQAILSSLERGASQRAACEAAGISVDAFAAWRRDSEAFALDVAQAEGRAGATIESALYREATREGGDWRAGVAWLERRRPEEWSLSPRRWQRMDEEEIERRAQMRLTEIIKEFLAAAPAPRRRVAARGVNYGKRRRASGDSMRQMQEQDRRGDRRRIRLQHRRANDSRRVVCDV